MHIGNRLFGILRRYDWNPVAAKYFLRTSDEDSDVEGPKEFKDGVQVDTRLSRMLALRGLKVKVERSHVRAHISQMEEENYRLLACVKEGFDTWVSKAMWKLGNKNIGTDEAPVG